MFDLDTAPARAEPPVANPLVLTPPTVFPPESLSPVFWGGLPTGATVTLDDAAAVLFLNGRATELALLFKRLEAAHIALRGVNHLQLPPEVQAFSERLLRVLKAEKKTRLRAMGFPHHFDQTDPTIFNAGRLVERHHVLDTLHLLAAVDPDLRFSPHGPAYVAHLRASLEEDVPGHHCPVDSGVQALDLARAAALVAAHADTGRTD